MDTVMSATVYAALREKYKQPAYALFFEVGNATGYACKRHADAVAVGLWPSRGLDIIGIEVKASRSDWKRELADPEKADAIFRYCDRWYLATPPDVVEPGELPSNWGHLCLRGKTLQEAVPAPQLQPVPLTRTFFAALARKAGEASGDFIKTAVNEATADAARELAELQAQIRTTKRDLDEFTAMKGAAKRLLDETGIDIRKDWLLPHDIKKRLELANGLSSVRPEVLQRAASQLQEAAAFVASLQKTSGPPGAS